MAKKIEIKGPIVSNDVGGLYHYFGWDASCPNDISSALSEANGDDVILEINSNGGLCTSGFDMYTQIMMYEGKVTAHVINAASAASLPVCAADSALVSDTAIFMIHNTQSGASGDYRDMQMEADALKEFNESVINAYVRKTGKSREELQNLMDNDTYMAPEKAIENGFIDGYMFGNPNESAGKSKKSGNQLAALNANVLMLPEDKAKEIMVLLKGQNAKDELANSLGNMKNNSNNAVVNINAKEGEKTMSLEEMLAENPEAKNEVDALVENARVEGKAEGMAEGAECERNRLQELDAISQSVTKPALNDAKYGENPIDAKELSYQAMLDDSKKATNYMKNAMDDSKSSGVDNVGCSSDENKKNEVEEMANYVNTKKGGKK